MYRSRVLASILFISAVGGGAYLMACGSDSDNEFDDRNGDGKDSGNGDPNGGGIPEGGIPNGGDGGGNGECNRIIQAVVRDFKPCVSKVTGNNAEDRRLCRDEPKGHPDFEHYQGDDATIGIVANDLNLVDRKPVYVGDGPHYHPESDPNVPKRPETTSKADFEAWYHDVPGDGLKANRRFTVPLPLKETTTDAGTKLYVFAEDEFFPVDRKGFGNGPTLRNDNPNPHNFAFTTEAHFEFAYKGGEVFTFRGDDDLWLFINGKLAIDLGGLHPKLDFTVNLDKDAAKLGIVKGQRYKMDLFHAERHTDASRFRIETTIECVDNVVVN